MTTSRKSNSDTVRMESPNQIKNRTRFRFFDWGILLSRDHELLVATRLPREENALIMIKKKPFSPKAFFSPFATEVLLTFRSMEEKKF